MAPAMTNHIDFQTIKEKYARNSLGILKKLLPGGKVEGKDYVALNPTRKDSNIGSFRIKISTGGFHDFATGDSGGGIIDLATYVYGYGVDSRRAAARLIEEIPELGGNLESFSSLASNVLENSPAKKGKKDCTEFIWEKSLKLEHSYLKRKGVGIGNARVNLYKDLNRLVIPLTDAIPNDENCLKIRALQFIDENGNKRFNKEMKGLFHVASSYDSGKAIAIICEGFATAVSIAESVDYYVVACMSVTNMREVALAIRKLLPDSMIVIAGDNDDAGRKTAEEAHRALGGNAKIIYPTHGKDFNDAFIKIGTANLKTQITELLNKEPSHGK
jgi:putative DNA primase/helicase